MGNVAFGGVVGLKGVNCTKFHLRSVDPQKNHRNYLITCSIF